MESFALILVGALSGTLVGFTGVGGGALMTPVLMLGFAIAPLTAIAADLCLQPSLRRRRSELFSPRAWSIVRCFGACLEACRRLR